MNYQLFLTDSSKFKSFTLFSKESDSFYLIDFMRREQVNKATGEVTKIQRLNFD